MPKKVWISGLWRGGIRRLLDDSLLSNLNFNIWLLDVYAMTHFFFLTTEKIARFFIVTMCFILGGIGVFYIFAFGGEG